MIWEIVCSVARSVHLLVDCDPESEIRPLSVWEYALSSPQNLPVSQNPWNVWPQNAREYGRTQIMVGVRTDVPPVTFPCV